MGDLLLVLDAGASSLMLNAPISANIEAVAAILKKRVQDVVVVVMDRPRHEGLVKEIRATGAALRMVGDGDIAAAIAPSIPDSGNGTSTVPIPEPVPTVLPPPALVAARSLTGAGDLIPPYPDDKLREGQEANIRLRLSIDASGRVTAVAPVGNADASFLSAARRHILKRWKYAPATRGGTPVASSQVVTIRFRLDG